MTAASDPDTSTRTPTPTVWPTFQAEDAQAMIDFLVDVVGFRRTAVYTEGDGARSLVSHAQLDWPEGGGVMLGSRRETSGVAPGIARGIGITPLQAEATLLVLLVALAHALVWEFLTHDRSEPTT